MARLLERAEVREAIFLASPTLEASLDVWLVDLDRGPSSGRSQKVERALLRYLMRSAGRPTPFGLFAGCAIGSVATAPTQLSVAPASSAHRHSRLNIDYLDRLCTALSDSEAASLRLRPYLTYRPNQTLHRSAGRMRLFASRLLAGERSYHVTDIEDDAPLQAVLRRAATGALLSQLVSELIDRFDDAPAEEANSYLEALIDRQVLVPDFGPIITGPPPFGTLLAQLARYLSRVPASARSPNVGPESSTARLSATLEAVLVKLRALDAQAQPLGVSPARYRQIVDELGKLPLAAPLPRLFQVDLTKPSSTLSLGPRVTAEVASAITLLHRLLPRSTAIAQRPLQSFAKAFVARFGDEEIPLLEALDDEAGVPFENDALLVETSDVFGPREDLLLDYIEAAQRRGESEVVLDDKAVARLASTSPAPPPLPDALCVRFSIAASSDAAISSGDFQICVSRIEGPSGVNLIGRFCHADPSLSEKVRTHLRAEERHRPDVIFAEVVHLPAGEVGNVVLRPLLREHEIPLLGRSGAPPTSQLQPDDLFVAVVDDRVVLRSRRLGREVMPRLTTAVDSNDARNLTVYRFLGALQAQGLSTDVSWRWGALSRLGFLPRIRHRRLVLSRARWRLRSSDLQPLADGDRAVRVSHLQALAKERGWPRFVALADDRSELPIDLENPLCVEMLAHLIKRRSEATIVELFPTPDRLSASGPDGRYVHEAILPFVRAASSPSPPLRQPIAPPRRDSLFLPGSQWLVARIATGTAIADRLLGEHLAPLLEQLMRSGAADHWFFTRQDAPDPALHIYVHGHEEQLPGALAVWQKDLLPLSDAGQLFEVSWTGYRRESDRYGGPSAIGLAERLFFADSETAMALGSQLREDEGDVRRFRLGMLGVDRLLDDFGFDLATKGRLVRAALGGFSLPPRDEARQLGRRFRREQVELEAVLYPQQEPPIWLQEGLAILQERSTAIAPIVEELRAMARRGMLSRSLQELSLNFAHAYLNRLLREDVATQERRLYNCLSRLYQRRLRRETPSVNGPSGASA